MMRHKIEVTSRTFGDAVIVLLSWVPEAPGGAYINFARRGLTRLEAMQQGSELMAWVESLMRDTPDEMPFDWVLVSSELDVEG